MKKIFAIFFIFYLVVGCNAKNEQKSTKEKNNANVSKQDIIPLDNPQLKFPQEDLLVGKWKRVSDRNQIVVYNSDHSATVFYNGKQTDSFQWDLVDEISNKNIKYKS